jgi:tRNA/rRNA methyltransferase
VSPPSDRTVPPSLHRADPPALARIAFVLVGASHPGNVGAAARAMKTMGLADLRLVAPRFADVCDRPEARAFASGAGDRLDAARRFDTLEGALADVALAVAVSAEPREFGPPPGSPETCAADALGVLEAAPGHRVAFVFGAERTGLSILEVQACARLLSIPASPVYSSLNLAQALQIVAYCLRREALERAARHDGPLDEAPDGPGASLATHRAVQGLLEHLERSLRTIGFLDPGHPKKLMPRLRRLFLRARLRTEEVDLLRGVCTSMERHERR